MKWATALHRNIVCVIAVLIAGCHSQEPPSSNQNVPTENTNEVSAGSPSRFDTQAPVHLDQWYQNEIDDICPASKVRIRFSRNGAQMQILLRSDLYRVEGAFFDVSPCLYSGGEGYANVFNEELERKIAAEGVASRPGGYNREFLLTDLSRFRCGRAGEWVDVFSGAPVEYTGGTVSVSMEQIDEAWMKLLRFSPGKDRFRVADDGLRLIGFDDPENWTFTLE